MIPGAPDRQRLSAIADRGGITATSIRDIRVAASGRIHTVVLVHTDTHFWVLQRVNRAVIANPAALAGLTEKALACFDLTGLAWTWPASGKPVLEDAGECWLCRSGIEGSTPSYPPDEQSLHAQAAALRRLHVGFSPQAFRPYRDLTVDPWQLAAAERLLCDGEKLARHDSKDADAFQRWHQRFRHLPPIDERGTDNSVVLHRDPKRTNFLHRPDGAMILIDFDTLGPGLPAQDLGEMLRALATADEVAGDTTVTTSQIADWLRWTVDGYDRRDVTLTAVAAAARVCCLRQCERFLLDHLTGDTYYPVSQRGDNRERALQQLMAFDHFQALDIA